MLLVHFDVRREKIKIRIVLAYGNKYADVITN